MNKSEKEIIEEFPHSEIYKKLDNFIQECESAKVPVVVSLGIVGTSAVFVSHSGTKGLTTSNNTPICQKFVDAINDCFKSELSM